GAVLCQNIRLWRVWSTAGFQCQVAGTPPFQVTWHKDSKEMKPSSKHGFSLTNDIMGLEVHKCDSIDIGEYQCTVSNEVGSCTCKTTLNLKEPPTFTKKIENTTTVLGKMAQFQCVVAGSPTLSVQWQKDENWILDDPKIERTFQNNVATLRVATCEASHSGRYTCQVVNDAGQDKCVASLTVQGIAEKICLFIIFLSLHFFETHFKPPSFVTPLESQTALPNAKVRFKGIFKGTPPFTVKWFKDDKELMTGPMCFTGLEALSCFLELYSVGVTQSGVYSCQVSNDAGSARCSADLTVKEPPEFVLKLPANKCVKQGESLRLECKVSGTAPLTVTWYKHDTRLTDGRNYRTSFANSVAVLEIVTSSFDDDGVYTCEAQNDAGSVSCSTTLTVKEPPHFVKVPLPIEGLKGKDVSLYCELSGTAPFQITWLKDKKPLMESRKYKMLSEGSSATLHVIGIESSDAGEYDCKASNSVGSDTCQTSVKLREPPSFVKKLSNMTVILGEEVSLVATVKGSEPITVSWLKDKDILRDSDNQKLTFENNQVALTVFKASASMAGKYTCQLRNDAGSVECFANLTVLGL
uniref:Ig-like domain-containing protein n=1 Tax=Periophthalmus magnuspinnatus TaxID=409849 RepID=A0A3B3ZPC3_9GOBI